MNRSYLPLDKYISSVIDYNHVPYRVRQKMARIQDYIIDACRLSKNVYKLCLFEEGCILVDVLRNKIIWQSNYQLPVLLVHLEGLKNYWKNESKKNSNQIEKNYQFQLRQIYG